jgi:hypothetical protein
MSLFFYILNIFLILWTRATETARKSFFDCLNDNFFTKPLQDMWQIEDMKDAPLFCWRL